ncbi:hypothetical protein CW304_16980 [Bacillus sp. UFRGS-B20]|nr:hypothetical protein CW304_16980 [Bacillus sp. UFRGS-B20]
MSLDRVILFVHEANHPYSLTETANCNNSYIRIIHCLCVCSGFYCSLGTFCPVTLINGGRQYVTFTMNGGYLLRPRSCSN